MTNDVGRRPEVRELCREREEKEPATYAVESRPIGIEEPGGIEPKIHKCGNGDGPLAAEKGQSPACVKKGR